MKEKDTHNEPTGRNRLLDSLRVTPFSVPDDFFSNQEKSIEFQLRIEKYKFSKESANYPLPDHYFDHLEEQILLRISESKLKEQVPILDYQVPDGYFETLELSIQTKIAENKLKESAPDPGFSIPIDYFADQRDTIQLRVSEDNLKSKVTKEGFAVPQNYFASLTDTTIKDATKHPDKNEATIIPFPQKRIWLSYISTAAVMLIIGIGSYFAIQKEPKSATVSTLQASTQKVDLHDVSNEEILDYLAQVSEGEDLIHLTRFVEQESSSHNQINTKIDDEEIKEYLNYML